MSGEDRVRVSTSLLVTFAGVLLGAGAAWAMTQGRLGVVEERSAACESEIRQVRSELRALSEGQVRVEECLRWIKATMERRTP